ncbi:MAG TPA: hypothetical protein VLJ79_11650 [Candidatus Binatia bacterium]|nr:hypothetical protein [Candidatus Binatia bacterium]
MKSINARTTLKLILSFSWLIALAVIEPGYAGDYYIYQDPNGKLVISNYAPPQGSNVIRKETLSEVTDQQIMESQLRENRVAVDNRLSSLERSVVELTENLRAQGEVINNVPEGYGDNNIAVGVTQGPTIVAKPPHKKFNRPPYFKRSLPNAQPRSAAPAARCCGGGRVG